MCHCCTADPKLIKVHMSIHLTTDSATDVTKLMAVLYYLQLLDILEILGCYCADCPLLLVRDRDIGLDYQYSMHYCCNCYLL
jgi:hypothetical protein